MTDAMFGADEYQKSVDSFKSLAPSRDKKYWVFAVSKGKYVNIGYKDTESEAYSMAYAECSDKHFEVVPLATTNIAEAHRRFKKILLERSGNLDNATSLISRKPAESKKGSDNYQTIFGKDMM